MGAGRKYDEQRLAELVMHIANRLIGDPRFGMTKLNKILFFADFEAYRRTGRSITGALYQHLPQGPCPHQLLPAIRSLGGDLVTRHVETLVGIQKQPVALRPAQTDLFSGTEIAIVDAVIDSLRGMTNRQVSDLSHDTAAWLLTEEYEEIPYGSAALSLATPTERDETWLKEVARRGGLAPTPS